MRTMKIASLYPIEVDPVRKVPCIEACAVRAGAHFFLHDMQCGSSRRIFPSVSNFLGLIS